MDPIADMITRIRNAAAVRALSARVVFSKLIHDIAAVLQREGWVGEITRQGKKGNGVLEVVLQYAGGAPVIGGIRRISKSSRRIYRGWRELRPVRQGYGMAILSTPQGLLTDREARKRKIGGEILLEIW